MAAHAQSRFQRAVCEIECGKGGVCSLAQENGDSNGTGDACERAVLPEPGGAGLDLLLGLGTVWMGRFGSRRRRGAP